MEFLFRLEKSKLVSDVRVSPKIHTAELRANIWQCRPEPGVNT